MFADLLVLLGGIAMRDNGWEIGGRPVLPGTPAHERRGKPDVDGPAVLKHAALLSARGEHRGALRNRGDLSRIDYGMHRGLSREVGALVN
jgi:hypothetical protein